MQDSRGVLRGSCTHCNCPGYKWSGGSSPKCLSCQHPPGVHDRLQSLSGEPVSTKPNKHDISEKSPSTRHISGNGLEVLEKSAASDMASKLPKSVSKRHYWKEKSDAKFASRSYRYEQNDGDLEQLQRHSSKPTPIRRRQRTHYHDMHVAVSNETDDFGTSVDLTDLDGTGFRRAFDQSVNVSERPRAARDRIQAWSSSQEEAISPDLLCIGCHKREKCPKNDGTGTYFDYCGNTCRNQHYSYNSQGFDGLYPLCVGCGKPCMYTRKNGTYHDYCGKSCRDAHLSKPNMMLPFGIDGGVSACNVSISQYDGSDCKAQFQRMWAQQKGACPSIEHVFLITNSILQQQFELYKQNSKAINVEQHFHGTSLKCDLTRNNTLCADRSCGICGISRFGFNSNLIGTNVSFQRFGQGFYLAPNSSKCHDYTQGCGISGYRAMLLCEVCPGKKYETKRNSQSLRSPPVGCDCVYGETGHDLNYPEIVLYNKHAILPKLIMLYKKDGTHKLV